jgi:hypothetical protein
MIYLVRLDYWEPDDAERVEAAWCRQAAEAFCRAYDARVGEWPQVRTVIVSDPAGSEWVYEVRQSPVPTYSAKPAREE